MMPTNLSFLSPAILGFLLVLPALWWLLRILPPAPKKIFFPALMLLRGLAPTESPTQRTPLWLLLLRLTAAALVILAAAQPVLNAAPRAEHAGTMLIALDNDWAAARNWGTRMDVLQKIIHQAARDNRRIIILPTTEKLGENTITATVSLPATEATGIAQQMQPNAWSADWAAAIAALNDIHDNKIDDVIWLAGGTGGKGADDFYAALKKFGEVRVLNDGDNPLLTLASETTAEGETNIILRRAPATGDAQYMISAARASGENIANIPISFTGGAPRAVADLSALPLDIRNQIARFEVAGRAGAATTLLLDNSWGKSPVGLVGDKEELDRHSLLSGLYYLDRALKPVADMRVGSLSNLLAQSLSLIIMDGGMLSDDDATALQAWVKKGGVFVRFADEGMANTPPVSADEAALLPVPLRRGDRALGGVLSWATPQKLTRFPATGSFRDLPVPDDVTVKRQILAEPDAALEKKTWATLADGTPLVTATPIGNGLSVLVHVPANATWSNLPLSGAFPAMLKRMVDMAKGGARTPPPANTLLPAAQILDGFGHLAKPASALPSISSDDLAHMLPDARHPPGLYGSDAFTHAFNLGTALSVPMDLENITTEPLVQKTSGRELAPYFLLAALLLLLADFAISLRLRGLA